ILLSRRIQRIRGPGQAHARRRSEVFLAVFAIAKPAAGPTIAEDPVHPVQTHDFPVHFGHELEVVRTQRAGYPKLRVCPVTALPTFSVHGNPVRMSVMNFLPRGMWVRPRQDVHVLLSAPLQQFTEWIGILHPGAAMMKRNLRRIISHDSASAETGRIRMGPFEIVQPELWIVLAWIVFH